MHTPCEVILQKLKSLGIDFLEVQHQPIMTVEEGRTIAESLDVEPCKCVLAVSRRHEYVLIMAHGEKQVPLKEISKSVGRARLSFAPADDLKEKLHTEAGAVSPLGLLFDLDKAITFVIDKALTQQEYLLCHPNSYAYTLKIKTHDLLHVFLPDTGHSEFVVFE